MKKTAVLLCFFILLLFCVPALAAAVDRVEVSIDQLSFVPASYEAEGMDCTFSVPEDWTEAEVSEEERSGGMLYRFVCPDDSVRLSVTRCELEKETTLEELAQTMAGWKDYQHITLLSLNAAPYIAYTNSDPGSAGILALIGETSCLRFDFLFRALSQDSVLLTEEVASTLVSTAP